MKRMLHTARSTFYANKIPDKAGNPKAQFRTVGSLLHTNHLPALPALPDYDHLGQLINSFSDYFTDKIATIRRDLDGQDRHTSMCLDEDCGISSRLSAFLPTTTYEITKLVSKSACKSCKLDPIPTHLLIDNISTLAPVIADIVNLSITMGVFSSTFKKALVYPLLKKTTMDPNDLKNYRSVFNLSFV